MRRPLARSIDDVLDAFGLRGYRPKAANSMDRQVAIVELGNWTVFADDWFYTLWHLPTTMPAIQSLAEESDVFWDMVGDCDESYAFEYWKKSKLERRVVVQSPRYSDQIVEIDDGRPFPTESDDRTTADIESYVDQVALSLGIPLPTTLDTVQSYGPAK